MSKYQIIDAICDALIPLLMLFILVVCIVNWRSGQAKRAIAILALTFYGLLLSYGIMYLDKVWGWWPSLGMDYSTHTAVAAVGCVVVSLALDKAYACSTVLIVYIIAMRYQEYHSLADMLSTLVVLLLLFVPAFFFGIHKKLVPQRMSLNKAPSN